MNVLFNSIIPLLIVIIMGMVAFHLYPAYMPHKDYVWVALGLASTLVIIVAEAAVDQAGLFKIMPKTQRLFFVALGCCCLALCGLYYIANLRPH